MLNTTLNLGKILAKAARKIASAKYAADGAGKVAKKTVELLGSGEVVEKLTEVASSPTPPSAEPAPTPNPPATPPDSPDPTPSQDTASVTTPEPSSSPGPSPSPTPLPAPPVTLEPLAPPPITLTRILPDGDNDEGKGWQCSKYAYYLATGTRMNYAPHPDYGPCHGADMVDYLITNLGWRECEKKNGAIFAYSDPQFGHTGVVLDASQNLVSDANTISRPLAVDTHILNLDSLGARYAEAGQ